ncbi:MAG TPA: cupin domain-containing protein [Geminicoccus sp.]|uniref:cupin domain-containing protein n=1 Tax=Geminicoccus sp. TaxID=2024832 RepID=UPI002B8C846C|nr:cupin domain-containing protein [Geminicoccus sp.]HWL66983.1 cupin domain-containing protein [Geminicoccus sp.]
MSPLPPFVRNGLDAPQIDLSLLGIELRVLIPAAASGAGICLMEEVTRPGSGPPLHVHEDQEECFYFLEGSYLLRVGDAEWRVGAGDVAVVPRGVPHAFANLGVTSGRLLFTLTPAKSGEQCFLDLAELLRAGRPTPKEINRRLAGHGFTLVGEPLLPSR